MQSFTLSFLARSAFLAAWVGAILTGVYGVGGNAIAAPPQNPDALVTIKSNHWAFQSLKSLAQRYGCVINSSGLYFQPSATPSRYEMAAAVNECLDQIADHFTKPEDYVTAQALVKEFKPEMDVLRARQESLGLRTATLETQQFSPTTKVFVEPEFYAQFPGLQPTHWSFQAIRSLSRRYHCTPTLSSTMNGQGTAISRYDMAVSINTCLNRIGHRFTNQTDLKTAQALQKEFQPEFAAIAARADSLEKRSKTLELNQFSTTTKLQGQAIITIQGGGFR